MLWRPGKGYVILPYNPSTGFQQGIVQYWQDDFTVYRDTSSQYSPPPGLFAPISGFGYLWRGDMFEEEGNLLFQQILGWATAPEVGYQITEQVGIKTEKQGDRLVGIQYQYLTLPDGRLLQLSRLLAPNQFTSLNIIEQ